MKKKLLLMSITGYVACLIINFVIDGVLLMPLYTEYAHLWRPEAEMNSLQWVFQLCLFLQIVIFNAVVLLVHKNSSMRNQINMGVTIGILLALSIMGSYTYHSYPIIFPLSWAGTKILQWLSIAGLSASMMKYCPLCSSDKK